MPATRLIVAFALALPLLTLVGCSTGPCPRGHELREERHSPTQLKARGCVGKDTEGNYRLQGRWEFFFSSGKKKAEGSYKDAFMGGEKGNTGILRDGREGRWVFWYENGQKESEATYRDGKLEGGYVEWHENGQKSLEGTFRDNKEEGPFVSWYENGQKSQEGTFRDGISVGQWNSWDENGHRLPGKPPGPEMSLQPATGVNPAERGEYLVLAAGCNDCHTPWKMVPEGREPDTRKLLSGHPYALALPEPPKVGADNPWAWGGAFTNTAFWGPWGISYAANLTPDELTGIGLWNEQVFVNALKMGSHMGVGRPILPPMPWQRLAEMTDDDLRAIYAYLRTIPARANEVPKVVINVTTAEP